MAKTSLEKSHSKASNFKLTLICFLTIIFFGALWCGLALLKGDLKTFGIILTCGGGVGTLLCILLLNAFSRG